MKEKYTQLTPELYSYVCEHRSRACDPVLEKLRAETEALGDEAGMLISKEQGSFLTLLVAAVGAKSAVEVGTFTGCSSLCIARGLPPDGHLLCIDLSEQWTGIASKYWAAAGLADKIELRLGAGAGVLRCLEPERAFDFAFIDADKPGYDSYYELLLPRMKPCSLIIFDNMLYGGKVAATKIEDENAQSIDRLNKKLAADARVESVLLPLADGIHVCRKK